MLALSLVAGACSGGGGDDESAPENTIAVTDSTSSTTTSTSTTTTTSAPSAPSTSTTSTTTTLGTSDEEQIESLVEDYWRVVLLEANDPPVPDVTVWSAVATPELSEILVATVQGNLDAGVGVRGLEPDSPYVLSVTVAAFENTATIFMCLRDAGDVYELASGDVVDGSDFITSKLMEAVLTESGWRIDVVETISGFSKGEEEACAASLP